MSFILVFIAEKSCEDNGRAAVEDVKKKKKRRKTKKWWIKYPRKQIDSLGYLNVWKDGEKQSLFEEDSVS